MRRRWSVFIVRRSLLTVIVAAVALAAGGCHRSTQSASSTDADTHENAGKIMDSGEKNAGPAAAQTILPAKPDNRPVLVCFGDSLTAGHGTDIGQSYPDYLQADLD